MRLIHKTLYQLLSYSLQLKERFNFSNTNKPQLEPQEAWYSWIRSQNTVPVSFSLALPFQHARDTHSDARLLTGACMRPGQVATEQTS